MNTSSAPGTFKPAHVHELLIKPLLNESVALQVANVLEVGGDHGPNSIRVPIVSQDPAASWTEEGTEIAPSDAAFDEVVAAFSKLAGLTIVSSELAEDTDPGAIGLVGQGLARDMARRLDLAFFGDLPAPAPAGLGSLTTGTIDAGTEWVNLDAFEAAIAGAETVGATITSFVANPADALELAQLKESSGSNRGLLQPDPTSITGRIIAGRPLHTSPAVEQGTVWAIPSDRTVIALRKNAEIKIDESAFFTSDQVAIRAVTRAAFAFAHEEAVQKIALTI